MIINIYYLYYNIMKTLQFINKFINLVDIKKEYSLLELLKILNSVCLENTKIKRNPTPYNLFVKKHYPILHTKYPYLNRGLIMKQCSIMWNTAKREKVNAFEYDFYS
tara:strand:- start:51 stop:371 length:321 start_codon:yes stop_codon:yes gene_type:complete